MCSYTCGDRSGVQHRNRVCLKEKKCSCHGPDHQLQQCSVSGPCPGGDPCK